MHLEHVNLTVSDVERSAAFYSDLLGLHVRWKGQTAEGSPAAHVGDDRSYLALFQAAAGGEAPVDYGAVGINHFGFVVDDLDATLERLHDLGLEEHFMPEYEPGRRAYFMDPDGVEVELVEYPLPSG